MIVWLAINSVLILIVIGALFLTIRQVGILLNQVGPVGARGSTQGPRIGENITAHVASLAGGGAASTAPSLYVFASESCAVCASVRKGAETLARYWSDRAAIRLVYDEHPRSPSIGSLARGLSVWHDPGLRGRLGVELVPFAVMTNAAGEVIGKGVVNDASQLESLLELLLPDGASSTGSSTAADTEAMRIRA
jgi:hypothetical protein